MNKRQRKKKYIETFSKFYDKSVETFGKNPQITINLIKKRQGGNYMVLSVTNSINVSWSSITHYPEIDINGNILMDRKVY